jgi:CRAL/TRIO domain
MADLGIIHQVIGAPSYFPTVWSWIKRWFDPVTVNKIFILGHHQVKAKLSEFIDLDDLPKKYGGNLDWDVGMSPHLDQAATEAVERNGSKGWIEGPCLWEQGQRVAVGTVNGKPRRPVELKAVPVPALGAAEVKAEVKAEAEAEGNSTIAPPILPPPPAKHPTENETTKQAPMPALNPDPVASTNPSSTAHSATTTSTSVTPPDITISAPSPPPTTTPTAAAAVSFPEPTPNSEGPIVLAGEVLPAGTAVKPAMERFVTAVEDLHLHSARAQVNSVVA